MRTAALYRVQLNDIRPKRQTKTERRDARRTHPGARLLERFETTLSQTDRPRNQPRRRRRARATVERDNSSLRREKARAPRPCVLTAFLSSSRRSLGRARARRRRRGWFLGRSVCESVVSDRSRRRVWLPRAGRLPSKSKSGACDYVLFFACNLATGKRCWRVFARYSQLSINNCSRFLLQLRARSKL